MHPSAYTQLFTVKRGWVAQSVAYPTNDLEVVGSIPGRVELLSGNKSLPLTSDS